MVKNWRLALAIPLLGAGIAALSARGAHAADHIDGPAATKDPAADITDVYAFMSPDPASSGHLVLVMNVSPFAGAGSSFSDKVEYKFHVKPITNAATLAVGPDANISCKLAGTTMTCTGPNSLTGSATVGTPGAAGDLQVFAGPRSDPFYFDLDAFKATVAAAAPKFTSPGVNKFASANVLSIVVEVDSTKAFGAGAILAVAAETTRSN